PQGAALLRVQQWQKLDFHHGSANAEQSPHILYQRLLAHEGNVIAALAFAVEPQRNGLDIHFCPNGRLKQTGMKIRHIKPGRSRTFRKQAHGLAALEPKFHLFAHCTYGLALSSIDKDSSRAGYQPADDGPSPDFTLGH